MKKFIAMILAVMMVIAMMAGCQAGGKDDNAIKIGMIGPLTGGAAVYGRCRRLRHSRLRPGRLRGRDKRAGSKGEQKEKCAQNSRRIPPKRSVHARSPLVNTSPAPWQAPRRRGDSYFSL